MTLKRLEQEHYGFAIAPDALKQKSRINAVLDGLISIGKVAGNQARFLYDFSPDSIILRWTHDFSPAFILLRGR